MATKAVQLKKRLIKEAVIIIVVLLTLVAGAYEVSDYDDQTLSEKQRQENDNNKLRSDNGSIQEEINTGSEVSAFYNSYIENHNSDFMLNREAVTQLLASLREKNHLANLAVTVSPVTDVAGNAVTLKTGKMIQSEVTLTFNALTDASMYGFIEAIQRQLPGIVIIHALKVSKTAELTGDILRDLSTHKIDPLATAELSFAWLGIRPNAEEKPKSSPDSLFKHAIPSPVKARPRHGP